MKTSTDYDRFEFMQENRNVDLNSARTKQLAESMIEYGWLDSFPATVKKSGRRVVVLDGQHRITLAREFGIPVKYVVIDRDIDVAQLNNTAKSWTTSDYADRYAKGGNENYIQLLEFKRKWGMPITTCAAVLSNTTTFGNISSKFYRGDYEVKSIRVATELARCWKALTEIDKALKRAPFIRALWLCFHTEGFSGNRLVESAQKHSGLIRGMSDIEGNLDMIEDIYNFGRKLRSPIKFDALEVSRNRNPTIQK